MSDDLVKRADEVLKDVTPGPWHSWPHPESDVAEMFWYVSGPTGSIILEVDTDDDASILATSLGRTTETVSANARFIAAARELVPLMRDRIEADAKQIAELEVEKQKWLDRAIGWYRKRNSVAKARRAAEARVKVLEDALRSLDKAASEVSRYGAQTGPQWSKLTIASLMARAALEGEK